MPTKDGEKSGGRQAGSINKANKSVKDTILEVFEELGGAQALYEWAMKSAGNRRTFYCAYFKMAPREVHVAGGEDPESLPVRISIEQEKE